MKAILDMQERVMKRGAEAAFNAAMTQAQTAMPVVVCDKENPHTRSKYPSLEACRPPSSRLYVQWFHARSRKMVRPWTA